MSLQRILSPFVDVRNEEAPSALLMFVYSFLAMAAYNMVQPLTRSKVIQSLGAVNVPWVILGSGLRLFPEDAPEKHKLTLTETRTYANGIQLQVLERHR